MRCIRVSGGGGGGDNNYMLEQRIVFGRVINV